MISSQNELIKKTKKYFGRDKTHLKNYLKSLSFDGSEFDKWFDFFERSVHLPVEVTYGIFQDVSDLLIKKQYGKVDWNWIGDLSWIVEIPLIKGLTSGLDMDKELALKNGGNVRYVKVFISDVIPAYSYTLYSMSYEEKDGAYGFKPINLVSQFEKGIVKRIKEGLKRKGYLYVKRGLALKKYRNLYSDINREGNASLFDVLFCDLYNYQVEYERYSSKDIFDPFGKRMTWREYYKPNGVLIMREEYRFFESKNVECVTTDHKGRMMNVKVWRDIPGRSHQEFELDIIKKIKKA